jgi:hypothetical protein
VKDTRTKPHSLVTALRAHVAPARDLGVLELARMRRDARELRDRAHRAEQEAWLLERAIDGQLAARMLEERDALDVEEAQPA